MQIGLTPIGTVVGGRLVPEDDGWDAETCEIRLDPTRFDESSLAGLDAFSHVEVVYHFHLVDEVTPMVLPVDTIPTFSECTRRVYMSATIADDSSIIRTFDADPEAVATPLSSKSLAGVSERMILIPELMPFKIDITDAVVQLAKKVAATSTGVAVLVPSTKANGSIN